jgi:hypothetical protein
MVRLQEGNNGQFFLTIPSRVVKARGWEKGDEFIIRSDKESHLVIIKDNFD